MKLLGWMHRKLRQNSGDAFEDLPTGPTCKCLSVSGGTPTEEHRRLSPVLPARLNGRPIRGRHVFADEPLLFEGLLSIGTLGSAPVEEEAVESEAEAELKELASAVTAAVEAIAEREETEAATETDLMVVNTELEKVLTEAAVKEGDSRLSSARPSHVTGDGKANEACPLQEFLFGAAADTSGAVTERKEKRASLGELFMIEEGMSGGKGGEGEVGVKWERGAGVNVMVKKILRRHGSNRSARSSASAADTVKDADAVRTAKFQKILHFFHRKIHPENEATSKKPAAAKYSKYKSKYTTSCTGSNCFNGGGGDPMRTPSERACRKGNKCGTNQTPLSLDGSNSTSSREHWIKTDADYLVLEL